jgi:hypothetical protein
MSNEGSEPETVDTTTHMRRPAEYFDDVEVTLVHIASTLRGALKLERLLTESGIPYAVETDAERTRALLTSQRYKVHYE